MAYVLELIKKYILVLRSDPCVWKERYLTSMKQSNDCLQDIDTISNMEGIGGDVWRGCQAYIVALKVLLKKEDILNKNQCTILCKRIEHVMKVYDYLMSYSNDGLKYGDLLRELMITLDKAYVLVKNCGKKKWCKAAVIQLKNKETFRELLLDLKCCYKVATHVLLKDFGKMFEEKVFDTIHVATYDEVEGDERCLYERLILLNEEGNFENCGLAKHLLLRVRNLHCIEGGELDDLKLSLNMETVDFIKPIGEGSYGKVYKSKWYGLLCATKKMNNVYVNSFVKEANILANLSHPNLISYYFAMKSITNEYNGCSSFEMKNDHVYLGMELMQTSLTHMLETNGGTSDIFLIDIMYQIARGMSYLHDMHIAHRDLKPDYILVNVVEKKVMNKIVRYAIVKVIDFGISKIEVGSNPEAIENNYIYGSTSYIAPEVLKKKYETMTMCPFDADVFSFAMVCCKILSKRDPFDDCKRTEILERIERGERPELPPNCNELTELIKEC
nr:light-sensor Protein kinase-like [Physcomitrium patens]PNR42078.1 hypothetical protein PHYPA_016907 [Physcomitrium patens]|eukprot:XP_024393016.1 light-sensor Protein kinase-like [Physcomitrella patens]